MIAGEVKEGYGGGGGVDAKGLMDSADRRRRCGEAAAAGDAQS
jgi:hypothetical protein